MLTNIEIQRATCPPGKRVARFTDSGGMYLEVSQAGSKRWFWKYYHLGKEKRLALGTYPDVSLKHARFARDDARKLLSTGVDPVQQRKADKAVARVSSANTYEAVARELHALKEREWSAAYAGKWLRMSEANIFPFIGSLPVDSITPPLVLDTLRRVEKQGKRETAHSLRQYAGQTFRYAIATGRATNDPTAPLKDALQAVLVRHMAAVLTPKQAGQLLRDIDIYNGSPVTREALLLSALTFQRPGEIRQMEWAELDFDKAMWTIPAAKMKRTKQAKMSGRPHYVPLSPQALASLERLRPLTGHHKYVFPSLLGEGRCMSENTVNTALRRMGYDNETMTAHGFRAMARTLIAEELNVAADVIEAQLAHGKAGPLGMAYDRAQYMNQRRDMMKKWANYLDKLRKGADVVKLRA
ncbi:tyrosine-type recombinase/integrase [Ottowia sp. SB7-C50]|uniref:tyrosine-type recombinase/integrase n=1 Tax=Ottowia sp. SB7-C50 TaxID=3081231 RepID=UPI0029555960|nr:integrase arm-type DNA-binding domain-containing protein [Ottowia sp. SB7-C50]WOP14507.1 tyrosine-type recombinase/integrase [Ottowia sp. SB7-C50]